MIYITPNLSLDDNEVTFDYIRASGPGGQNVNKVSTAVQMRYDLRNSLSLPPEVKQRLEWLAAGRLTTEGILLIEAKRFRTQEQNRADALARLTSLIQKALEVPKKRRATRPTLSSQNERLQSKQRRGQIKKLRGSSSEE